MGTALNGCEHLVILREDDTNFYLSNCEAQLIRIPKRILPPSSSLGCWINLEIRNGDPIRGAIDDGPSGGEVRKNEWMFIHEVKPREIKFIQRMKIFAFPYLEQLVPLLFPGDNFLEFGGKIIVKKNDDELFISRYSQDAFLKKHFNFGWIASIYSGNSPILQMNEASTLEKFECNQTDSVIALVTGTGPGLEPSSWYILALNGRYGEESILTLEEDVRQGMVYTMGTWVRVVHIEKNGRTVVEAIEKLEEDSKPFKTNVINASIYITLPNVTVPAVQSSEICYLHPDLGCIVDDKRILPTFAGKDVDIIVTRSKGGQGIHSISNPYRLRVTKVIPVAKKNPSSSSSSDMENRNLDTLNDLTKNLKKFNLNGPKKNRRPRNVVTVKGSELNAAAIRRKEGENWKEKCIVVETQGREQKMFLFESMRVGYFTARKKNDLFPLGLTLEAEFTLCNDFVEFLDFHSEINRKHLSFDDVLVKFDRSWCDYRIFSSKHFGDIIDVEGVMKRTRGRCSIQLIALPEFEESVWVITKMDTQLTPQRDVENALYIFAEMFETRPMKDQIGAALKPDDYDILYKFFQKNTKYLSHPL